MLGNRVAILQHSFSHQDKDTPVRSGGGVGKWRRAWNNISGIWIPPLIPLWLHVNSAVNFFNKNMLIPVMKLQALFPFPALPPELLPGELARRLLDTFIMCTLVLQCTYLLNYKFIKSARKYHKNVQSKVINILKVRSIRFYLQLNLNALITAIWWQFRT